MRPFVTTAALLLASTATPGTATDTCAAALKPGVAALPPPCRALGPVSLGMSEAQVTAALGPPDFKGPVGAVYIFPRALRAALAQKPVAAAALRHSELAVSFIGGSVSALSLTAGTGTTPAFARRSYFVGAPMAMLTAAFGKPSRWNASHDEASYDPLPIAFMVDETAHRVFGVTIGVDRKSVTSVPQVALVLHKQPGSDLVSGFSVRGGE